MITNTLIADRRITIFKNSLLVKHKDIRQQFLLDWIIKPFKIWKINQFNSNMDLQVWYDYNLLERVTIHLKIELNITSKAKARQLKKGALHRIKDRTVTTSYKYWFQNFSVRCSDLHLKYVRRQNKMQNIKLKSVRLVLTRCTIARKGQYTRQIRLIIWSIT